MNQNFDLCLVMLLAHEGGFVDHPDGPGDMANPGVTKADYDEFYGGNATEEVMKALTKRDVEPIYRRNY
jgi:lysozyme family protein